MDCFDNCEDKTCPNYGHDFAQPDGCILKPRDTGGMLYTQEQVDCIVDGKIKELLMQSRRVRGFWDANKVFQAVPVAMFDTDELEATP